MHRYPCALKIEWGAQTARYLGIDLSSLRAFYQAAQEGRLGDARSHTRHSHNGNQRRRSIVGSRFYRLGVRSIKRIR